MSKSSQETKLSKEIRDALAKIGIMLERIQSGIVPLRHGGFLHAASAGTPDVWTGLGFIEIKDKTELSQEQLTWHAKAKKNNVRVEVARSVADAIGIVNNWRIEDNMTNQNQVTASEISNAAKRLSLAKFELTQSAEWVAYIDAMNAFNVAIGNAEPELNPELIDDVRVEPAEDNAPVCPDAIVEQPYDDATIDVIVRRALSGIDDEDSALTVGKLAKDCDLSTEVTSKSLRRIGANSIGQKRGTRYYIPVAKEATEE